MRILSTDWHCGHGWAPAMTGRRVRAPSVTRWPPMRIPSPQSGGHSKRTSIKPVPPPSSVGRAFTGRNLEFKQPPCADTRKNHTRHLCCARRVAQTALAPMARCEASRRSREARSSSWGPRLCVPSCGYRLVRICARPTARRRRFGPAPANGGSAGRLGDRQDGTPRRSKGDRRRRSDWRPAAPETAPHRSGRRRSRR